MLRGRQSNQLERKVAKKNRIEAPVGFDSQTVSGQPASNKVKEIGMQREKKEQNKPQASPEIPSGTKKAQPPEKHKKKQKRGRYNGARDYRKVSNPMEKSGTKGRAMVPVELVH